MSEDRLSPMMITSSRAGWAQAANAASKNARRRFCCTDLAGDDDGVEQVTHPGGIDAPALHLGDAIRHQRQRATPGQIVE